MIELSKGTIRRVEMATKQKQRKQVSVRDADYVKLIEIRDELQTITGSKIMLCDAMARAIECLDDSHRRGAWMAPHEMAPALKARLLQAMGGIIMQLAEAVPNAGINGVTFSQDGRLMLLAIEDDPSRMVINLN